MLGFCPLASGSKGNCIYLGTKNAKILIDAGISGRAITQRLDEINVAITEIDAILITHEHSDHIQGLRVLAYRMGIPVFANKGTASAITETFGAPANFKIFTTGETFYYNGMEIHPFSIQHDTNDPVAFTIKFDDLKLGFCTDLGFVTSLVRGQLKNCDYLYIEANHEPSMVHACPRPMVYKQRVLGRSGHLSNEAAGQLLMDVADEKLKHVHLAHLSQECNSPIVAKKTIEEALQKITNNAKVSIAYQEKISHPIFFSSSTEPKPESLAINDCKC